MHAAEESAVHSTRAVHLADRHDHSGSQADVGTSGCSPRRLEHRLAVVDACKGTINYPSKRSLERLRVRPGVTWERYLTDKGLYQEGRSSKVCGPEPSFSAREMSQAV